MSASDSENGEGEEALARVVRELRQRLPLAMTYLGSSASLVASSIMQLITMAILARTLGVAQFGHFLTMTALATIAVHICGLGASEPLVRRVARDPSLYPRALGHNLILIGATGIALSLALVAVLPFWVRVADDTAGNIWGIAIFVVANVVVLRIILLAEQAYIAHMQFTRANIINMSLAVTRLVSALVACYLVGISSLAQWIEWQAAGLVALAVVVVVFALRPLGAPRWGLMREEIGQGVFFSTAWAVRTLKQTGDILVLGLVASPSVVGAFGLSRRIVETSGLTLDALFRIMYPRLSRAMEPGIGSGLWLARRLLVASAAIAVVTAVALYIVAPLGPLMFGTQFTGMVGYLHAMCWLLIPAAFTGTGSEVLGASGQHGVRASIYFSTVAGVGLIAIMTYFFATPGTVLALYVVEVALSLAFWLAIAKLKGMADRHPTPVATSISEIESVRVQ